MLFCVNGFCLYGGMLTGGVDGVIIIIVKSRKGSDEYMVAGMQIDMFSYLEDLNYQEPPVLVTTGQNVFMVVRSGFKKLVGWKA